MPSYPTFLLGSVKRRQRDCLVFWFRSGATLSFPKSFDFAKQGDPIIQHVVYTDDVAFTIRFQIKLYILTVRKFRVRIWLEIKMQ